ncbi:MAG: FtsQ-type POTRA domain-containing protein [Chloroflexi bacterium]|nr:FtsQ-type POTRA domain-containing protein [Chloroflexota bacterium]
MTTKSREERRAPRQRRAPAIWQPGADLSEHPPVQQAVRSGVRIRMRAFSAVLSVCLIIALALSFTADAFYVHSIAVGGLRYMTASEIYDLTNIVGLHAFWIDPAHVRQDLLRSPTIADAQVIVGWPPDLLTILISEREPALVWEQGGQVVWIDVNGRVMRLREDRPELLRVQADEVLASPVEGSIGVEVIGGALQLQALLPAGTTLRYHPDLGLGYNDQRGWLVWTGTGTGMAEKLRIVEAIASDVGSRGARAVEINVVNPDAPHVATLRRGQS